METTKICSKCKIEKDIILFSKNKKRKDGLDCRCKNCAKEYYIKNKEKILSNVKQKYIKNKKEILLYQKEYYDKNKDYVKNRVKKYANKNKEKIKEYCKKYLINNREKINKHHRKYYSFGYGLAIKKNITSKRRAIKKDSTITSIEILKLQQNAKKCYWCGISLKNIKTHIDHYIPLSKGGEHTLSNLVISCPSCNLNKSSKDPFDFANSRGRLC